MPKVSPQNAQITSSLPTPAMLCATSLSKLTSHPSSPPLALPSPVRHFLQEGRRQGDFNPPFGSIHSLQHRCQGILDIRASPPGLLPGICMNPSFPTETALTSHSSHQSLLQICNASRTSTVTAPRIYPDAFLL